MADELVPELKKSQASAASVEEIFQRRIDFHPARKDFSALSVSAGGGDFRLETLNPSLDPQRTEYVGREGVVTPVKRSDVGEFFEYGLDPELSFRTTFRRIGAGLKNLGNTCFLNSVLQCLTYTEPFAAYLQSGKHKNSCRTAGFCALCALQTHVMAALQSTGKILSPKHLVQNLRCISRNFRNARQEDAHEYMVNLLESMHKCCLPSGVPSESPSAYDKSLVHKIFGGHLRSQVKCTKCGYCSNKSDPFLDLSLEIHRADSLLKALKHFTALEELDGGQKQYQCDRCKEKVRAFKQLTIHKAPCVLTIHLKRFDSHIPGQKIDRKVEFEPTLDLKPFVSGPNVGDLKYTLYGVLVHAGWSTHSGHYFCYVRTSTGLWHSLDDNQVTQVSEKAVLAQKAYMLFYVRDKTTSVKRSADAIKKENICTNAPGNKLIPPPISDSNRTAQNLVTERKMSNMGPSFPKARSGLNSHEQFTSGQTASSDDMLSNRKSISPNNDALSRGLHQASSETNSKASLIAADKSIHLAKKDVIISAHVDNIVASDPVNVAPMSRHDESNSKTYHSHNDCNEEMKRDIVRSQSIDDVNLLKVKSDIPKADACSFPGLPLTSEKENEKLMETPVQQSGSVTPENAQSNIACRKQAKSALTENELMRFSQSHECTMVHTEASDTVTAQHVIAGYVDKNCSSSMHSCDGRPHNKEKRTVALTKQSIIGSSDKKQSSSEIGPTCKERKQNRLKNLLKGFGRNKLFLASMSKHKFKKSKNKKHHLYSNKVLNKVVPTNASSNNESASTSETINGLCVDSKHIRKRHYSAIENKDNMKQMVKHKDLKPANGSIEAAIDGGDALDVQPMQSLMSSSTSQCKSSNMNALEKVSTRHDVTNFLMGSLRETSNAGWDEVALPKYELEGLLGQRFNNIGYVLDEWDEEYDKGRRKKVKKSKESFMGPNPFQETANEKAQFKLKVLKGQGNQPFRI